MRTRKITRSSRILKKAIVLIRSYNIRYSFDFNMTLSYAKPASGYIKIGCKRMTEHEFLCVVHHEIAHVLNYRNGKYLAYHTIEDCVTPKHLKKIIATAVKAEKYTDKVAAQLMATTYPRMKYVGYTPEMLHYFRTHWMKQVRIALQANIELARENFLEQFR